MERTRTFGKLGGTLCRDFDTENRPVECLLRPALDVVHSFHSFLSIQHVRHRGEVRLQEDFRNRSVEGLTRGFRSRRSLLIHLNIFLWIVKWAGDRFVPLLTAFVCVYHPFKPPRVVFDNIIWDSARFPDDHGRALPIGYTAALQ